MITAEDIFTLYQRTCAPTPTLWAISPTVLRRFRRIFLSLRKRFPAPKRFKRAVHRAHRASGALPLRPRRGPWGGTVAVVE